MRWLVPIAMVAGCSRVAPLRPPSTTADARQVWQAMQRALPGAWSGTTGEGARVEVTFRSISSASALAERFGSPGKETMTLYHADHAAVVATHYCGQGNQPRLRVTTIDGDRIVFAQADVTDLDPGESSLVEMELTLGDGWFDRVEVYRDAAGALERTRWHFVRRP